MIFAGPSWPCYDRHRCWSMTEVSELNEILGKRAP